MTEEAFERQLEHARELGFRSGRHDDLERLARGERVDERLVFLTFDDGYVDNHATARPLLEAYGFRGLIFLLPPRVDHGERPRLAARRGACGRVSEGDEVAHAGRWSNRWPRTATNSAVTRLAIRI